MRNVISRLWAPVLCCAVCLSFVSLALSAPTTWQDPLFAVDASSESDDQALQQLDAILRFAQKRRQTSPEIQRLRKELQVYERVEGILEQAVQPPRQNTHRQPMERAYHDAQKLLKFGLATSAEAEALRETADELLQGLLEADTDSQLKFLRDWVSEAERRQQKLWQASTRLQKLLPNSTTRPNGKPMRWYTDKDFENFASCKGMSAAAGVLNLQKPIRDYLYRPTSEDRDDLLKRLDGFLDTALKKQLDGKIETSIGTEVAKVIWTADLQKIDQFKDVVESERIPAIKRQISELQQELKDSFQVMPRSANEFVLNYINEHLITQQEMEFDGATVSVTPISLRSETLKLSTPDVQFGLNVQYPNDRIGDDPYRSSFPDQVHARFSEGNGAIVDAGDTLFVNVGDIQLCLYVHEVREELLIDGRKIPESLIAAQIPLVAQAFERCFDFSSFFLD